MKKIILYGMPGVGKSTFAGILSERLGLKHINMGNLLRNEINFNKSELSLKFKAWIDSGHLIPDNLATEFITQYLIDASKQGGYILDGYPRTINQGKEILNHSIIKPDRVLHITLDRDVAVAKLMGRRTCQKCDNDFNVVSIERDGYEMPPILPTKETCPHNRDRMECQRDFFSRSDDVKDIILMRFDGYENETGPILDLFEGEGKLVHFQVNKGIKDTEELLQRLIS